MIKSKLVLMTLVTALGAFAHAESKASVGTSAVVCSSWESYIDNAVNGLNAKIMQSQVSVSGVTFSAPFSVSAPSVAVDNSLVYACATITQK